MWHRIYFDDKTVIEPSVCSVIMVCCTGTNDVSSIVSNLTLYSDSELHERKPQNKGGERQRSAAKKKFPRSIIVTSALQSKDVFQFIF